MSSAFAHAAVGFTIAKIIIPKNAPKDFYIYCALAAAAPDVDIIAFKFGIPYSSMFGHRGLTHAILFAPLAGWAISHFKFKLGLAKFRSWLSLTLAILSHGFLDAFTNGGLGVGFFIPFSAERYFFKWQVLEVSPINPIGFWAVAKPILLNEGMWVGLPCVALLLGQRLFSRSRMSFF